MCDYSLQHLASRPAKLGDRLVTTDFSGSVTRGFADPQQPNVAVCLLPGTEIAFDYEIERMPWFPLFGGRRLGSKVARFRRVNETIPTTHHDAVELPGGKIVLLTHLRTGQRAVILQLPRTGHVEAAEAIEKSAPRVVPVEADALEP